MGWFSSQRPQRGQSIKKIITTRKNKKGLSTT